MPRYQVQLETLTETFSFEVVTEDFDAEALARKHLATLIPPEEAERAHLGGYGIIGHGDATEVNLVRRR